MIHEHTLAVGPALRWILLALSGVFLVSVAVITAGDAIFKRLQRRALNKVTPLDAVCLSVWLLTSQLALGKTREAQPRMLGHSGV